MSQIRIDKRGRRIVLYSATPVGGLKTTVPGAYQSTSGHWTVPLSIESCKLLRLKFGNRLDVSNELKRWAHGVQQSRKYMKDLAKQTDAKLENLPRLAPKLAKAMRRRTYQRVGVRFIADNHASLIADDPGLGKTLICMGGILEAEVPGPYLIIAPKTASESVWQREIQRWLPINHRAVTMPQFRYQRERALRLTRYTPTTWVIIHPEMAMVQSYLICAQVVSKRRRQRNRRTGERRVLKYTEPCGVRTVLAQKQVMMLKCGHKKSRKTKRVDDPSYARLFAIAWGAIVVDESHESLIRRGGVPTQRRRGLDMLATRNDGLRIAMSGTPFDSKPHQLWGTLNWLDSHQHSAFHRWAETFWQKGGYTGYEIGEFRKDREQMLWDSLSAIALRRTKAEVAPDLPPKMEVGTPLNPNDPASPIGVWLEMDGQQEKAYREMEELSETDLDSGALTATTALAELTRLKQLACSYGDIEAYLVKAKCDGKLTRICRDCRRHGWHQEQRFRYKPTLPSNKFDWIVDSLEEWGYPKNPLTKVVIVSFFTGILGMYQTNLEKHFRRKPNDPLCTAITGRTPAKDRRAIIDRFNDGGGPDVMMLNVKAGGTAITLDTADRMIFASETRIPDQQSQAEDRIHRVSNPRQCMYYYLRSVSTVDVGTAIVNAEMRADTHRLLDQRRGVDYMRHVLDLSRGI
jgi:SNF2 family DNA or RNA helicase